MREWDGRREREKELLKRVPIRRSIEPDLLLPFSHTTHFAFFISELTLVWGIVKNKL